MKKSNLISYIVYLIVSSLILRDFFGGDTFGLIYDWSESLLSSDAADKLFYAWNSSYNGSIEKLRTVFLQDLLVYLMKQISVNPLLILKAGVVFLFSIMGYGTYLLLREYRLSYWPSLLAGLFYLSSVFFSIRFSAGYLTFLTSGAFFPLLLLFFIRCYRQERLLNRYLPLLILMSLFAFSQMHFVIFFLLFVFCELMLSWIFAEDLSKKIKTTGLFFISYLFINLFWLIPSFKKAGELSTGSSLNSLSFLSRLNSLPHSFWNTLLLSDHANTQEVLLAVNKMPSRIGILFLFLAVIFFFAYKHKVRRKLFVLFLVPVLIMLPITVGATPPFSIIYPKLFSNLPGISLFRETYHLQYLILLFYTICLALALDFIIKKINPKSFAASSLAIIIPLFFIILFNLPSFDGRLYGYMGSVELPSDLAKVNEKISELTKGRVFYPPNMNFWKLNYDKRIGVNYPDQIANSFNNPSVNQASSDLDVRNPSWKLRNATANAFMSKDELFLSLLPYLGSDLIVDRKYLDSYFFESVDMKKRRLELRHRWMSESNEGKLKSYPTLSKIDVSAETSIYKLNQSKGLVYLSTRPVEICNFGEVSTDVDSFFKLPSADLAPYLQNSCTEEEKNMQQSKAKLDFSRLDNLKHSADFGWSPGYLSFYEGMNFSNQIDDFIFTRVPDQFNFNLEGSSEENLYVQYYGSPRSGKIQINDLVIDTNRGKDGWQFEKIDQLRNQTDFTVKSLDGENAIGFIGYIKSDSSSVGSNSKLALSVSNIEWKKINPTKYQISIKDKTAEPKLIILSENFNQNWKLNIDNREFSPLIVNTYANAYLIPGELNGNATIEFKEQKTYRSLMFLSFGFSLVLIIGAVYLHRKEKNESK